MATNLQPYEALTYLANTDKSITSSVIDDTKITLSAYAIPLEELLNIPPANRISGSPLIKMRIIAVGEFHDPACGAWSDPVSLGTPLATGEGLRITLDKTEAVLQKNVLGLQIALATSADSDFRVPASIALDGDYVRVNKVPDQNIVIDINCLEGGWPLISQLKESAPTYLYGAKARTLNFGLGENGITLPHAIKSFDSSTDGVTTQYKYDASFGAKFSVNPAEEVQLKNVLQALGYNYFNGTMANFGTSLSSVPKARYLDLDLPYITTSGRNRLFVFGVNHQTLTEAALSAAINSKNPFEIDFKWIKTPYFHQSQQTFSNNK